jgi:hypothetical protein
MLVLFVDASMQGIGAVICVVDPSNSSRSVLLTSKSRLAAAQTVPRFEF